MSAEAVSAAPLEVVVVDDTPDLRDLLRLALERRGEFRVVAQAANGQEGIDLVRTHQPEVVLLDIAMPVMDGLEALPLIREACPMATVVMLSGFGATEMTERALASGADGYVQKGQPINALLAKVRSFTEQTALARGTRTPPPPQLRRPVTDPGDPTTWTPSQRPAPDEEVEALRRSIATAAHEIRNPVSILGAAAEALLEEGMADEFEQSRMLEMIGRQAHLLDAITADLLTAGQAQHGTLSMQLQRLAPGELVGAITAGMPDVTVVDTCTAPVLTEPYRFQQMLGNLLGNAHKYGAPPIVVRLTSEAGQVLIDVEDDGEGVPVEFRPQLFQEYARAPGSQAAGTGLGLYVVRALAQAHGGNATYRPGPTRGSVFSIRLPAAPA